MKYFILALSFLISTISTTAQQKSSQRTIKKSAQFADKTDGQNKFRIMNINGSVTIEAYDGETVELTVEEKVEGSSSEIEKAKEELVYKLEQRGNLILAYVDAPFITLRYGDRNQVYYQINRDDDGYKFTHDVHVKVPRKSLLEGSTINKGKLTVTGPFKEVEASNVNGELELRQMASKTCANTVNGDITITYDKAPDADSEYHTVNGTIKVFMPDNLSADVYFKSMHGDLYTDFDNVERLQPEVQKNSSSNRSGVTYHVEEFSPIRIGNGGTKLRFQVLNGDVYIRKQS